MNVAAAVRTITGESLSDVMSILSINGFTMFLLRGANAEYNKKQIITVKGIFIGNVIL
jgi:hypothetical protein